MSDTIVAIKRHAMRGGEPKIVISFGDASITIRPTKQQQMELITLLAGGPSEQVSLPGEQK